MILNAAAASCMCIYLYIYIYAYTSRVHLCSALCCVLFIHLYLFHTTNWKFIINPIEVEHTIFINYALEAAKVI